MIDVKSILIIGGDSEIGSFLFKNLSKIKNYKVFRTSRRFKQSKMYLDFTDFENSKINFSSFDCVIICVALTNFKQCEENVSLSELINLKIPLLISKIVLDSGGKIILFSTSAVFNSKTPFINKNAIKRPTSIYGKHKSILEDEILALGEKSNIFRISKVITSKNNLFLNWIKQLKNNHCIEAFDDLFFSPISIDKIIDCTKLLIKHDTKGLYQYSGDLDISYYEAIKNLCQNSNLNLNLLSKISCRDHVIDGRFIIKYTTLKCSKLFLNNQIHPENPHKTLEKIFLRK